MNDAVAHLERGDLAAALTTALEWWRARPHARLAALVIRLGAQAPAGEKRCFKR